MTAAEDPTPFRGIAIGDTSQTGKCVRITSRGSFSKTCRRHERPYAEQTPFESAALWCIDQGEIRAFVAAAYRICVISRDSAGSINRS